MPSDYEYDLPKELIADEPADPRDSSRLFVYDTAADRVTFDTFANLAKYLPKKSPLVLNNTKVVPSRLVLTKKTGGQVTILFLMNEWDGSELIKGLPDKGVGEGEKLFWADTGGQAPTLPKPVVEVVSHKDEEFTYKILISAEQFREVIEKSGRTPLPPYIHSGLDEKILRQRYQTVFATSPASVAAPTASLHFTPKVFADLAAKAIEQAYVTLHVGRGTFSPVTDKMHKEGKLHGEPIYVSADDAGKIALAKVSGTKVIAVGTTALRVLESEPQMIIQGREVVGETELFVKPPYKFAVVDALVTNFHLPGTSLLILLDAFMQNKNAKRTWKELYEIAVAEKFRFYSFGDAMLII